MNDLFITSIHLLSFAEMKYDKLLLSRTMFCRLEDKQKKEMKCVAKMHLPLVLLLAVVSFFAWEKDKQFCSLFITHKRQYCHILRPTSHFYSISQQKRRKLSHLQSVWTHSNAQLIDQTCPESCKFTFHYLTSLALSIPV